MSLVLSDYVSLAWLLWVWLNHSSLCFRLKPLFLLTKSLRSIFVCFKPLSQGTYMVYPVWLVPSVTRSNSETSEYKVDPTMVWFANTVSIFYVHDIWSKTSELQRSDQQSLKINAMTSESLSWKRWKLFSCLVIVEIWLAALFWIWIYMFMHLCLLCVLKHHCLLNFNMVSELRM